MARGVTARRAGREAGRRLHIPPTAPPQDLGNLLCAWAGGEAALCPCSSLVKGLCLSGGLLCYK